MVGQVKQAGAPRARLARALRLFAASSGNLTGLDDHDVRDFAEAIAGNSEPELFGDAAPEPLDVVAPLARRGFLTAITLTFAHTVGEFGVVLMVGGNIPGQTRVLSIAIYDHAEALEYTSAHILAGGLLAASFLMLLTVYALNRRYRAVQI